MVADEAARVQIRHLTQNPRYGEHKNLGAAGEIHARAEKKVVESEKRRRPLPCSLPALDWPQRFRCIEYTVMGILCIPHYIFRTWIIQ